MQILKKVKRLCLTYGLPVFVLGLTVTADSCRRSVTRGAYSNTPNPYPMKHSHALFLCEFLALKAGGEMKSLHHRKDGGFRGYFPTVEVEFRAADGVLIVRRMLQPDVTSYKKHPERMIPYEKVARENPARLGGGGFELDDPEFPPPGADVITTRLNLRRDFSDGSISGQDFVDAVELLTMCGSWWQNWYHERIVGD